MMKNKKKEDNEIVSGKGGGTWEGVEMDNQELFMEFENNKERINNSEKKKDDRGTDGI